MINDFIYDNSSRGNYECRFLPVFLEECNYSEIYNLQNKYIYLSITIYEKENKITYIYLSIIYDQSILFRIGIFVYYFYSTISIKLQCISFRSSMFITSRYTLYTNVTTLLATQFCHCPSEITVIFKQIWVWFACEHLTAFVGDGGVYVISRTY